MKIAPFVLCSLVALAPRAFAQPETVSPGQQVLRACANTYKSLREFEGGAAVISQSRIQIGQAEATTLTQTADASFDFKRDKRFLIYGTDTSHSAFSIESTPLKTSTTWQLNGKTRKETPEDLEMAIAGFTGVAATAPTKIPGLLLSSRWGFPFVVENVAILKGSEIFGGHKCFVVTQRGRKTSGITTLWIDTKSFLLRGMREEQSERSFPLDLPAMAEQPAQTTSSKILFSNAMHIFSIEKTLPNETELAATAKAIDIPQMGEGN